MVDVRLQHLRHAIAEGLVVPRIDHVAATTVCTDRGDTEDIRAHFGDDVQQARDVVQRVVARRAGKPREAPHALRERECTHSVVEGPVMLANLVVPLAEPVDADLHRQHAVLRGKGCRCVANGVLDASWRPEVVPVGDDRNQREHVRRVGENLGELRVDRALAARDLDHPNALRGEAIEDHLDLRGIQLPCELRTGRDVAVITPEVASLAQLVAQVQRMEPVRGPRHAHGAAVPPGVSRAHRPTPGAARRQ